MNSEKIKEAFDKVMVRECDHLFTLLSNIEMEIAEEFDPTLVGNDTEWYEDPEWEQFLKEVRKHLSDFIVSNS